jgi:hypothetical protein
MQHGLIKRSRSQQLSALGLALGLGLSLASCGTPPQPRSQDNSSAPVASPNPDRAPVPTPSAKSEAKPSPKADAKSSEPASPATSSADAEQSDTSSAAQSAPKADAPGSNAPGSNAAQPATAGKTEETTIYQFDENSGDFVGQKATVPSQDTANALVGKVLATTNSPDFKIENYRVKVENGTATVDLRLAPDAKRPFTAMSAYEQQAILGSVQKTLTSEPKLKIQSVRFTDGKESLEF